MKARMAASEGEVRKTDAGGVMAFDEVGEGERGGWTVEGLG